MYIPTHKWALVREIKHLTWYTISEIERVYDQVRYAEPRRAAYYAKKAALKRLQWWLVKIRNKTT